MFSKCYLSLNCSLFCDFWIKNGWYIHYMISFYSSQKCLKEIFSSVYIHIFPLYFIWKFLEPVKHSLGAIKRNDKYNTYTEKSYNFKSFYIQEICNCQRVFSILYGSDIEITHFIITLPQWNLAFRYNCNYLYNYFYL